MGLSAASATAILAGLSVGSPVAHAAGCSATATEVADGVFEIRFTNTTACDWNIPDGVTQLEVLLVGSGGGSVWAYAGGGGEVKVLDLTGATGSLSVKAGSSSAYGPLQGWSDMPDRGNVDSVVSDGTNTYFAVGGYAGATAPDTDSGGNCGGTSGSGQLGHCDYTGNDGGGGAGGAANSSGDGGQGITVADIASTGSLFAGITDCFGGGGASVELTFGSYPAVVAVDSKTPGCGGGVVTTTASTPFDVTTTTFTHQISANTGGGAGALSDSNDGSNGIVVVRYAGPAAPTSESIVPTTTVTTTVASVPVHSDDVGTLTSTGANAEMVTIVGAAVTVTGVSLTVSGRRRRPAR